MLLFTLLPKQRMFGIPARRRRPSSKSGTLGPVVLSLLLCTAALLCAGSCLLGGRRLSRGHDDLRCWQN